jgi:hypothetical protein
LFFGIALTKSVVSPAADAYTLPPLAKNKNAALSSELIHNFAMSRRGGSGIGQRPAGGAQRSGARP